eukprot:CAMPEP_0169178310 /NCGR_PEP_ID=MMETSP1015-20121227/66990_1 /TAXON_ID=342587 /ORGANISM="Karlodinium micrum, Strain CCMP2283" /LENGTH=280 /DNA_ID=CAMNT_0009253185 /DNA_START=1 /DNA_END=839 /DNA_ORIENTATION=-
MPSSLCSLARLFFLKLMTNLYKLLGVRAPANLADLKAAYRRKMLEVHPDKGGDVTLCQQVMAAFELLANPQQRRLYDRKLEQRFLRKTRATTSAGAKCPAVVAATKSWCTVDLAAKSVKKRPAKSIPIPKAAPVKQHRFGRCRATRIVSTPATTKKRSGAKKREIALLARIVALLQCLSQERRRQFISERLSERQRRDIEAFMKMTKCSSSSSQPFLARGAAKIRSERGVARKLGGKKRTFQESHIRQPTVTKQSRVAKTQLHSRELWAARQLATGARGG